MGKDGIFQHGKEPRVLPHSRGHNVRDVHSLARGAVTGLSDLRERDSHRLHPVTRGATLMGHSCVYRCDRCGNTSEPSPGSELPPNWAELHTMTGDPALVEDTFAADLCPQCAQSLQGWLRDIS